MGRLILRSSVVSGGSQPAIGDAGYNGGTQTATASTIIFDLRQDYTESGILWLTSNGFMARAPSYQYLPTGGYWGSGTARWVPGYFTGDPGDPLGQHVCGLGQLNGFNTVVGGSGCRQIVVGQLFRFGSGWISEQNGLKDIILSRLGNGGGGGRPMIVPKWYDPGDGSFGDIIFPACDDEICIPSIIGTSGTVTAQSPAAFTLIDRGSTITITLGGSINNVSSRRRRGQVPYNSIQ